MWKHGIYHPNIITCIQCWLSAIAYPYLNCVIVNLQFPWTLLLKQSRIMIWFYWFSRATWDVFERSQRGLHEGTIGNSGQSAGKEASRPGMEQLLFRLRPQEPKTLPVQIRTGRLEKLWSRQYISLALWWLCSTTHLFLQVRGKAMPITRIVRQQKWDELDMSSCCLLVQSTLACWLAGWQWKS